jgi:hypothetical protein
MFAASYFFESMQHQLGVPDMQQRKTVLQEQPKCISKSYGTSNSNDTNIFFNLFYRRLSVQPYLQLLSSC